MKVSLPVHQALTLAHEEARRLNHSCIGTHHLLIGLMGAGEGQAAQVLTNQGLSLVGVRTAAAFILGKGEGPAVGEISLSPRAERVIERAEELVRYAQRTHITTFDLLLALFHEEDGTAAGILSSFGVNRLFPP